MLLPKSKKKTENSKEQENSAEDWQNFFNIRNIESIYDTDSSYNHMSIFSPEATRQLKIYETVTNFRRSPYKDNLLLNRALGSIMGHAIGDSMGSVLEFREVDYRRKVIFDFDQYYFSRYSNLPGIINAFQLKVGQFTDDFSMALCLADSLLINGKLDCVDLRIRFVRWWQSGYNNAFRFDKRRKEKTSVGLGGNISESFNEAISSDEIEPFTKAGSPKTSGNGSIMRLSPAALFYHNNLAEAIKTAEFQSLTTHQGIEAADCCKILAFIIVKALNLEKSPHKGLAKEFLDGLDMNELLPYLKTENGKLLAQSKSKENPEIGPYCKSSKDCDWNWKQQNYKFSPTREKQNPGYIGSYAMDALTMALHCVYWSSDFGETVLKTANLGGDSDSMAAVAGQIAGAIYGIERIKPIWLHYIMRWDNKGEIPLKAMCCILPELKKKVINPYAVVKRIMK